MLIKYKKTIQGFSKIFALSAVFAFGFSAVVKQAEADYISDVTANFIVASAQHFSKASQSQYPKLLGYGEKRSGDLSAFTKWSAMFERFAKQLKNPSAQNTMASWSNDLAAWKNLPLRSMASQVNTMVNSKPYIVDNNNWNRTDYWATPIEFLERGGDCEDFAIAKYTALRMLGVPESRMRIAIVHDNLENIPHAILIVYDKHDVYVLDNQNKDIKNGKTYTRYKPIFTINRQAWWLHSIPSKTVLASAQ